MPRSKPAPSVGLWIDCPARDVLKSGYFDKLQRLGIGHIAVMLDTSRTGFDPKWKHAQVAKLGALCQQYEIELVLTVWPDPDLNHIEAMAHDMAHYVLLSEAAAVEVDTEFNWKASKAPVDFDAACQRLVEELSGLKHATGCKLELTTFTSHTENGRAAKVAPHMDRLFAQAYSVRTRRRYSGANRGKKWEVPWNHSYGPGSMQRLTLDRTQQVGGVLEGRVEMCVGLPAYDQSGWPGKSAMKAMGEAWNQAVLYGCPQIRYWSSKWVIGRRANRYAAKFIGSRLRKAKSAASAPKS